MEKKKKLTSHLSLSLSLPLSLPLSLYSKPKTGRCPVFLGSKADVDEAEACLAADPEHLQARK